MHPLVSIALVLATALLWLVFTVLMLARVNPKAPRQARKAVRMDARPGVYTDVAARPGRARLHHLKVRRRNRSSTPLPHKSARFE